MSDIKISHKALIGIIIAVACLFKTTLAVIGPHFSDFINIVQDASFTETALSFKWGLYTFTIYLENLFYRIWLWLPITHTDPYEVILSGVPADFNSLITIFIFKFPILLFDLLTGAVIYKIVEHFSPRPRLALSALVLWLFNPYTTLLLEWDGTWDIFSTFFLVTSWWTFLKNRKPISGVFLGLSIIARFYAIILLPFFLIISIRKRELKNIFTFLIGVCSTLIIALTPFILKYGFSIFETIGDFPLEGNKEFTWFFGYSASTAAHPEVSTSIVFSIYFITLILAAKHWRRDNDILLYGTLITLIAYLAFSHWNRYYSTWVLPFITVDYVLSRKRVKRLNYSLLFALFFVGLYIFNMRWTFPYNQIAAILPQNLREIFVNFWIPFGTMAGFRTYLLETFGRSLLAAVSIIYIIHFSLRNLTRSVIAKIGSADS
ncbi:hypothetical protein [[Eubacterium] cellulosolvens]